MKVSIVMPVYNGEKYIEFAIKSIINQTYNNIQFILVDGGSTDGTMNIVNKNKKSFDKIISEKDKGMYDAINKGFAFAKGDIMLWLNSDDFLFPNAIETAVKVMTKFNNVKWLKGRNAYLDCNNNIRKVGLFKSYYRSFIKKGFYRSNGLGFIMQETTFWHKDLYFKAGGYVDINHKLASDFELWTRFAKHETLYSVNTLLGAFRQHGNQLSVDGDGYENECSKIKDSLLLPILKLIKYPLYLFAMLDRKNKISVRRNSDIEFENSYGIFF